MHEAPKVTQRDDHRQRTPDVVGQPVTEDQHQEPQDDQQACQGHEERHTLAEAAPVVNDAAGEDSGGRERAEQHAAQTNDDEEPGEKIDRRAALPDAGARTPCV